MKNKFENLPYLYSIATIFILGFFTVSYTLNDFKNSQIEKFNLESKSFYDSFSRKTIALEANVKSFQSFFQSTENVDFDMFRIYSQNFLEKHPRIKSITYSPKVKKDSKSDFEEDQEYWGFANYSIKSMGDIKNDIFYPITYIEPFNPISSKKLGFDIYSNKTLNTVINNSILTGNMIRKKASNEIIYLLIPTYEGKNIPKDDNNKRKNVNGIILFEADRLTLLKNIASSTKIDFKISYSLNDTFESIFTSEFFEKNSDSTFLSLNKSEKLQTQSQTMKLDFRKNIYLKDISLKNVFINTSIFLFISLCLLYIARTQVSLKRELEQRKLLQKENESLLKSFDENVIASKTDLKGVIIYASKEFANISGYTVEEMIGKPQNIVRHPDMPSTLYKELWQTIKLGKTWRGEIKNLKNNGDFYWTDAIMSADFDENGKIIGYSSIRQDITAKKEVEELSKNLENKVTERTKELNIEKQKLAQNEKQIKTLVDTIPSIIFMKDVNGKMILVNEYHKTAVGLSNEDVKGKTCYEFLPYDVAKLIEEQDNVVLKEAKSLSYEEMIPLPDGTPREYLTYKAPLKDHKDKVFGMVGIATDITERKNAEQQIKEKNKLISDSLNYASSIQGALIPEKELFEKYFEDYFAIWEPKDIVGGDIYLFDELRNEDECLLFVIDCTGHGVPGAFVTMLVKAIERQIASIIESDPNIDVSPAWCLEYFNRSMKKLLQQEDKSSISNAGFDGQILYYNKKQNIVKFASARNEIFYVQNGEITKVKGDRHSIGYKDSDANYKFKDHIIDVSVPTSFYISSDGYWDQMGGEKELCFSKKRVQLLIDELKDEPMLEQKEVFISKLREYQGDLDRQDDITFIGLKIKPQDTIKNENNLMWSI